MVKKRSPSGSSTNCGTMTPGVRNEVWMFHTGQAPPYSAMLKEVALNRLVTLPALSTRRKKNGTPRAPSRWRVVSRRSEEHTSELQSLMRISYAVFCLKKTTNQQNKTERRTEEKTSKK